MGIAHLWHQYCRWSGEDSCPGKNWQLPPEMWHWQQNMFLRRCHLGRKLVVIMAMEERIWGWGGRTPKYDRHLNELILFE